MLKKCIHRVYAALASLQLLLPLHAALKPTSTRTPFVMLLLCLCCAVYVFSLLLFKSCDD